MDVVNQRKDSIVGAPNDQTEDDDNDDDDDDDDS